MVCDEIVQYVIESREENLIQMTQSQDYQDFFYFKGKVYAYNEVLRLLTED